MFEPCTLPPGIAGGVAPAPAAALPADVLNDDLCLSESGSDSDWPHDKRLFHRVWVSYFLNVTLLTHIEQITRQTWQVYVTYHDTFPSYTE